MVSSRVAEEEVKGTDDPESRVSLLRPAAKEAECLLDSLEAAIEFRRPLRY